MHAWRSLALFLLAATVGHAAWQAKPAPPVKAAVAKEAQRSKPAPAIPDSQLEAAIRAKLAKSKISADHFTVKVQGGVATFEGQTDVVQHKGTATRLAKTAGAIAVNNKIQVSEAARAKAKKNLQEGRRRAQIKRSDAPTPAVPQRQLVR